eukprot:TRINITY_DN329_c1_g1_i1.p1 TRINITY_DN329_c1_g1~~TRINITY_DN329_c1_g1_i1.p1  ORF type:complete len:150 (+),score=19.28 TRINITY_DN329_c1_g1_i1:304-753(+)
METFTELKASIFRAVLTGAGVNVKVRSPVFVSNRSLNSSWDTTVNGKLILWGTAGGLAGFIVINLLGLCLCCCCCYRKKRSRSSGYSRLEMGRELDTFQMDHHPETDTSKRRKEFYAKWGTPEERQQRREAFDEIYRSARTQQPPTPLN